MGCATDRKPTYSTSNTAASTSAHELNVEGIRVTLDPFVQAERSKTYFGINGISDGIGILFVKVENSSKDKFVTVTKKDVHLITAGSSMDRNADGKQLDRSTAGGEVLALTGGIGPILAGLAMVSKATEIRRNFVAKELADQSLSPGESVEGFVYFSPVAKGKDWSKGARIRVDLFDTKTKQPIAAEARFPE